MRLEDNGEGCAQELSDSIPSTSDCSYGTESASLKFGELREYIPVHRNLLNIFSDKNSRCKGKFEN